MATQLKERAKLNGHGEGPVTIGAPPDNLRRRRMPEMAGGLLLVLVCALGALWWQASSTERQPVLALRNSVERGDVVQLEDLQVVSIDTDQAKKNCIKCWKAVIGHAEKKNVNLVLEHLNSRDDSHPMKGHPGYFGDDVDVCVELINAVGSNNMKLLFDVYHVQVMNGDVIRRIRQYKNVIGHYHTAGNPGRCELDENQEINYPAVMKAILETGYTGYVAQEFIPTWKDKIKALRHSVMVCDV